MRATFTTRTPPAREGAAALPYADIRFDKCLITKTETGRHRGLPARNAIFIMETSSVSLLCQLIPNDAHVFAVNIRAAAGLCPTDVRPLVCREAGMCIA